MGGGGVREATARQGDAIWQDRFPSPQFGQFANAPETPVGVTANWRYATVAGTRFLSSSSSVFELLKYDVQDPLPQGYPRVAMQFNWPVGDLSTPPSGVYTAVASAFLNTVTVNSSLPLTTLAYVTGTVLNPRGEERIATIACSTTEDPNAAFQAAKFLLKWSAVEKNPSAPVGTREIPVAIVADGHYVAVVGKSYNPASGWDTVVYCYEDTDGSYSMKPQYAGMADDIPVGVTLTTTYWGAPAVVVAVTTPDPTTPGMTSIAILGWQCGPEIGGPGNLPNTALRGIYVTKDLTGLAFVSDSASAMTQYPQTAVISGPIGVTGTRSFTSDGQNWFTDFVTGAYDVLRSSPPLAPYAGYLEESWVRKWDNPIDDIPPSYVQDQQKAVAICLYDPTATATDPGHSPNFVVVGTSQTPSDAFPRIAAVNYPTLLSVYEDYSWWAFWEPPQTETTYVGPYAPTSVVAAQLPDANPSNRIYISGYASKLVNGVWNRDYAALSLQDDTTVIHNPAVWTHYYSVPWNGSDLDDVAAYGWAGQVIDHQGVPHGTVLFTGKSDSFITGLDWVTMRVQE